MKPVKLRVKGFMPFRAESEVDLSGLQLFAIQGPTGSGKSSLLDAMTYALYGKTDRLGGIGAEALISSGEDQFLVELTFELGGSTYRVTRSKGRSASRNQVRLEEYADGRWKMLASTSREVEKHLTGLLGLDFQSFTRAVMLPQGKFSALLHGSKTERQKLLGELAGLGHVEKMYDFASQRAKTLESELSARRGVLGSEYTAVTPESLREAERESRTLSEQLLDLRDKRDDLQARLNTLRARQDTYRDWQGVSASLEALSGGAAQVEAGEKRAAQARRVSHLLPALEDEARGRQQLAEALARAKRAEEQAAAFARASQQAQSAAAALTKQAEEQRREQAEQLERLDASTELRPSLERQRESLSALERAETAHGAAERESRSAGEALTRAHQALAQAQDSAAEIPALEERAATLERAGTLSHTLQRLGGAPQPHPHPLPWDEDAHFQAHESARKLDELRRSQGQFRAERARLERQRQHNQRAAERCAAEEQRLLTLKEQGKALRAEERAALEAWHQRGLAQYHADLKVGEPCPLCAQVVRELPPPAEEVNVTELNEQLQSLNQIINEKVAEYNTLKGKLQSERQQLQEKERELNEKFSENDAKLAEIQLQEAQFTGDEPETAQRYLAGLARQLLEFGPDPAAERRQMARRVAALRQALQGAQDGLAQASSAAAAREAAREAARNAAAERRAEAQAAEEALTLILRRLSLSSEEAQRLPDPAAERRRLQGEAEQLQRQLEQARAAEARAQASLAAAQASLEAAQQAAQREAQEDVRRAGALQRLLAAAGLSAEEVTAAALPEADITALEGAARQYHAQREALTARLSALEARLGLTPFDPAALPQTERELYAVQGQLDAAQQRSGELRQRLHTLRERLARKQELEKELSEQTRKAGIWQSLKDALKTSAFQQFLLEDLESRLLSGAGALLFDVSDGRYRLSTEGGDYMVQDLWNAGELRGVKTLSGGETFLASLALAITLSDYLAGSKVLGALFLDEGFGTLDPQALESVAEALESLRVQGRMVGVITHVESLSERMPSRIVVSKSVAGSSLTRLDS